MLCFRDMTFCPYYCDCEKGSVCMRALTPSVEADAKTFGLDVCRFLERPECFVEHGPQKI